MIWIQRLLSRLRYGRTLPTPQVEPAGFGHNRCLRSSASEEGNQAGLVNHLHINDVLDSLPSYFDDLRKLRSIDEDAYALFRNLGGCFPSPNALFSTSIDRDDLRNPPGIRCLFLQHSPEQEECVPLRILYLLRLSGGRVIVDRNGAVTALPEGLCYRMVVVFRHKDQLRGDCCFVHVGEDGAVHPLPGKRPVTQIITTRNSRRGRPRRSSLQKQSSGIPAWLIDLANEHGVTPEKLTTNLVAIGLSAKRPKSAIMVRAEQAGLVAAWTVGRNDAKRFFARREGGRTTSGQRKRVLHYVGAFDRVVAGELQEVREHYRGERSFDWNGYHVEVSGLGFHHGDVFDADLKMVEVEEEEASRFRMIGMERLSRLVRERYSAPLHLRPTSKQRRRNGLESQ